MIITAIMWTLTGLFWSMVGLMVWHLLRGD